MMFTKSLPETGTLGFARSCNDLTSVAVKFCYIEVDLPQEALVYMADLRVPGYFRIRSTKDIKTETISDHKDIWSRVPHDFSCAWVVWNGLQETRQTYYQCTLFHHISRDHWLHKVDPGNDIGRVAWVIQSQSGCIQQLNPETRRGLVRKLIQVLGHIGPIGAYHKYPPPQPPLCYRTPTPPPRRCSFPPSDE
eukprot:766749-Hanusia_phi.AAC.1